MKYYFDTNARVQAWIEAESKEKASDIFCEKICQAENMEITVDTYQPEMEGE